MSVNHKVIRLVVALAIGVFLALFSYQRITDQEPGQERALEEAAVLAGREILQSFVAVGAEIEIVDPLAPSRVIGKVYIYPAQGGWQLSGYYRRKGRNSGDKWHPYLMSLDEGLALLQLSVKDKDEQLKASATSDPRFTVDP
jgi:hypothetical protein